MPLQSTPDWKIRKFYQALKTSSPLRCGPCNQTVHALLMIAEPNREAEFKSATTHSFMGCQSFQQQLLISLLITGSAVREISQDSACQRIANKFSIKSLIKLIC